MSKAKKYRNKAERIANAKKRGGNIELFRPISDCNPADLGLSGSYSPLNATELGRMTSMTITELLDCLGITELYFKAVGAGEAMRDMNDVEMVMLEKNMVGTYFAYRRVGEKTRAMQQVIGFIEPKQVIGETGEEAAHVAKPDAEPKKAAPSMPEA